MSLPTCPSCGQSVLEDDAVDCPFCGAAMDGSRGAKNTPRPKANPTAHRPGAKKVPPPPPEAPPKKAEPPAPVSRPAAASRAGGKPRVDEDDPFGMGSAGQVDAIQATAKPEKGRLLKVVCPMCEQVGFVPKSAVGRPVRCANEKCMVPVFTAADPNDKPQDRKPQRMSDEADAARRLAESSGSKPKSPVLMYAIVGTVGLAAALGLVFMLNRKPDDSHLNAPISAGGGDSADPEAEEEAERQKAAKLAAAAAAAAARDPKVRVAAINKRMITIARTNVRDKAEARKMTGDLYLRIADPSLAAQELNQLATVDRSRSFYRMEPYVAAYWRELDSRPDEAAKSLQAAIDEVPQLARFGRAAGEAALGLAAALANEDRIADAAQLVASRQLDRSTPGNRDLMSGTAWLYLSSRCRGAGLPAPTVLDAIRWADPLPTVVAGDLAAHRRWKAAVAWATSQTDARVKTDSLVLIADLAREAGAGAEVVALLEGAIQSLGPAQALMVRAAAAAAAGDAAKLTELASSVQQWTAAEPVAMPDSTQLIQRDIPDLSAALDRAAAAAEVARTAVIIGQADVAQAALDRMQSELAAAAPPTASLRALASSLVSDEAGLKNRVAGELKVSDENRFARMFRDYRRHLEQFSTAAEDRRLLQLLLLSRVIVAGGTAVVDAHVAAVPDRRQELMLDELCGLVSSSVRMAGSAMPASLNPDAALFQGQAAFGDAQAAVPVGRAMELAWAGREKALPTGLQLLSETGPGNTLPGFRQALVLELLSAEAKSTNAVADLLSAIQSIPHEVWREESLMTVGRILGRRSLEQAAEDWLQGQRIKPLEQITLLYGISLGLLDQPAPEPPPAGAATAPARDGK